MVTPKPGHPRWCAVRTRGGIESRKVAITLRRDEPAKWLTTREQTSPRYWHKRLITAERDGYDNRLRQYIAHNLSMHVRQPIPAALMLERQSLVVDAEQV